MTTPIDPARVLAALSALGWPDDREEEQPGPEPVGHFELRRYWTAAENVVRAIDNAGQLSAPTTPPYVHHLLDAFLTGQPLNFRRDSVPLDVQRRLDHAVSAGQLGTVPDRAVHVLTVASGREWEIDHPADCVVQTPTGPAVICLVHDLAVEQLPAAALPPGQYQVEPNDIGDKLCIFDRVADLVPAAGRGCRCEPGEG
ncbi:hypothetical protein ABT336_00345 [Micromonospora sp. NPDC000207]|uniref:hypothetical protein n=1 Tax=Micromonospora sp. NPDC000207 TaxID=3154246 RepID=UPI00333057C8